jgi:ubiquinone/menaquinone biosynthesis C-methylase UbiE
MRAAWERFYGTRRRPWAGAVELPEIRPGSLVLETGCGGGRLLVPLGTHRPGVTVVGIDLVQADVASLPFREGTFDIVLCRHVLGHLAEAGRRAAASEMLRVLKAGGLLLFEGFSTGDARFGKGQEVEPATFARGDGIWHHYFTSDEVGRLFAGAGPSDVRETGWEERAGRGRMKRAVVTARISR